MRSALTIARITLAASLAGYGIMIGVMILKLIAEPLILFWPILATAILIAGPLSRASRFSWLDFFGVGDPKTQIRTLPKSCYS